MICLRGTETSTPPPPCPLSAWARSMSPAVPFVLGLALLCCQLPLGGSVACAGSRLQFGRSCYQFFQSELGFWSAREACAACGGHLARAPKEGRWMPLKGFLNGSKHWWVDLSPEAGLRHKRHHAPLDSGDLLSEAPLVCAHLSKSSGLVQAAPFDCFNQHPFICEYDSEEGQDCEVHQKTSSKDSISVTSGNLQEQSRGQQRIQEQILHRSKRLVASVTPLDLAVLMDKLDLLTIDQTLLTLVRDITVKMQDEEERSLSDLEQEIALLSQLSEKLQDIAIRSALNSSDLTTMAFYGINGILQTLLSTCSSNNWTAAQKQSISQSAVAVLHNLQLAKVLDLKAFDHDFIVKTPMFYMQILRTNSSELGFKTLSFEGEDEAASMVFPEQSSLRKALQNKSSVTIQMTSYFQNPFPSDSSMNITGTVSSMSILSGAQEVQVQDLPGYFQIFLPRPAAAQTTPSVIKAPGGNLVLLTLEVTSPGSTLVIIAQANEIVSLELSLWFNNLSTVIAGSRNSTNTDTYTWIVPPALRKNLNMSCQFHLKPTNYSGTNNLTFSIFSFITECAYWNESGKSWSSNGCKVGPQTDLSQVQCLCNHLSFFGSSFFVLPAQLDLTKTAEYFSKISENPVIVILLACFYACYIISVIWVRKMDTSDKTKVRVVLLPDNDPCALYRYLVTVCTGNRRGATTTSKVFITLTGSAGQSDTHHLSDPKKVAFKKGNIDVFLLTTPFPLGELKSITLWQDASGSHKSWYVLQVTVQDLEQRQRWHFLCNTWLAEQPKGMSLSMSFPAADKQELTSFRNIFMSKTKKGLQDENIWISIVAHPTRSSFTRVQRVSCCMCLLLCTVVINLMFWELPQISYPVLFSFGSFTITWKDIMIGFESALLMFPVNLLIIYIFRNTNPRPAKTGQNPGANQKNMKFWKRKGNANTKQQLCRPSLITGSVSLDAIMKNMERLVQSLNKANRNHFPELEKKLEASGDVTSLLQLVKQMFQNQGEVDKSHERSASEEELHAIFCGHFTYRKLLKISNDLQRLGPEGFPDRAQYDQAMDKLQSFLRSLEKSVPPLKLSSSSNGSSGKRAARAQKKPLPWWFIFVGWFLLLSMSGVSTYFTMMYGFKYGKESSIRWIISMAISLFQSIFVLQPLKVVGFAIFFALVLKKVDEEEEPEIDAALKDLNDNTDEGESVL